MAIQVNGTSVITDARVLQNVTGLKTINSTSILGTGNIVTSGGWTSATSRTAVGSAPVTLTAGTYICAFFFFSDNNSGTRTISPISAVEYLHGSGYAEYLGANGALYHYNGTSETSTTAIQISNFGSIVALFHLTASATFTQSTRVVSMYYTKLS